MNYATGRRQRPLTPRRPADRGRVPSLGPYLLAAARPRSLRRHGAVTGHGRAGLTDHTTRNGPVRTSAINRRSGCVCARDRRRPSEDREGAGGHPEVTGARALRGKRPGHAPQCAPARGLPAPVPHRLHNRPSLSKYALRLRGVFPLQTARQGRRCSVSQDPKKTQKENLEIGSFTLPNSTEASV